MEQNLTFADLGLSEEILQALEKKGYGYPTRIQAEAIPEFLQWKDVIAKAPTGTGKTFAFGIPMIEHIDAESEDLQGLILAPTRELAIQICDELRGLLTYYKNIRVAVVYGGAKIEGQIKQLKAHPQIVVATPGRLMDHYKRHTISFDKVQTVVLDEADRMLDMGFFDDVTKIIEKVKNRRNLGLFSATISQEVMTVSWMYQRDEVEITVPADTDNRPDITQYSITCPPLEKIEMTSRLIRTLRLERTIVFCNTKVMCQRLRDDLVRMGLDADCIHGDIPQQKREKTMRTFKEGKLPILIATDVASRGIDVDDVDCVLVAIVGAAGLEASHAALTSNKRLALANKESLVVGGDLLMPLAQPGQLIPVDSEHSAIYQCYLGENPREAHCIWLTCSGGPFLRRMDLTGVTVEEASTHPRWKMGRKITVDSATLMNKALEVIEARWLFDIPPERIRVVIHPQSILHSGVAFEDGAVMAELGVPDMRTPIAVAMAWPERTESGAAALDFTKLKEPLTFEAPDLERFPQLKLAWEALEAGDSATIVLNAANEAAVAAFLDRKISFLGIGRACREALSGLVLPAPKSLSDIYAADREARSFVDSLIRSGRIS